MSQVIAGRIVPFGLLQAAVGLPGGADDVAPERDAFDVVVVQNIVICSCMIIFCWLSSATSMSYSVM